MLPSHPASHILSRLKFMLVIRLFRVGKKNQPSFKIVVTDKRKPPRSGRFVEEVGFYSPLTKEKVLKPERIKYWMSKGAKPSDTVYNLLVKEKILEGKKIDVHKKSKKAAIPSPAPPTEVETPGRPAEEKEFAKEKPAEESKTESTEPGIETKKEEEKATKEKETKEIPEPKTSEKEQAG